MELNGLSEENKGSNGYHDASSNGLHSEEPKFEVEPVQLQFSLNNSLRKVLVQNNKMALIMEKGVIRIDLENPSNTQRTEIDSASDTIVDAWMHPSGSHLLVKTKSNLYYYLHYTYSHFKHLGKFKGKDFRSMSFFLNESDETTEVFLLATTDSLYLSIIKPHNPSTHANKRDDKYLSLIYKSDSKIYGSYISGSGTQIDVFCEGKVLSWPCFEVSHNEILTSFNGQPKVVNVFSQNGDAVLYFDSESYLYVSVNTKEMYSNDKEIQLSQTDKLKANWAPMSNHIILSQHHLIVLEKHGDQLVIINKLTNATKKISLKGVLATNEKITGVSADHLKHTYWLYSTNKIYELVISDESISVWYNYYKMGKYEEAIKCIGEDSTYKKDMILIKQGYDYLQKGGFGIEYANLEDIDQGSLELQVKGIKILANSTEPFEKICLMLLNLQNYSDSEMKTNVIFTKLLIEFLSVKYEIARTVDKNKIRIIILSSWILDLMLRTMYSLRKELESIVNTSEHQRKLDFLRNIEEVFDSFVEKNYKYFDTQTVYQIIKDMNFPEKLLRYAELIKDYQFIIDYYINTENWLEALKVLVKAYLHNETKEIVYKTASVLLSNAPKETVITWLKLSDLKYEKLLPSILSYNRNKNISYSENQTIIFLQKILYDKTYRSRSLNNYYLSLLITYPAESDGTKIQLERAIVRYLNQLKSDSGRSGQQYDSNFILRLCLSHKKYQAAILILISDMNLYEQALKLALDNNLTRLANLILLEYETSGDYAPDSSNTLKERIKLDDSRFSRKKKLWLLFAQYLIDGVLSGKRFDILEKNIYIEKGRLDEVKRSKEMKTNYLSDLSEISKSIVNSDIVEKEISDDSDHSRPTKVLKYLLSFSEINNLTLKDLLPLFPETININKFKNEIIDSLNQYNSKIGQLTSEMTDSLDISRKLKDSIRQLELTEEKGKIHTVVEPGDYCRLCKDLLISKNFICFPNCKHNFHKECLIKYYLKVNYKFKKVFENFKRNSHGINKQELESVLLKECVLCNDTTINSIDDNIVDLTYINRNEEWKI